MSSVASVDTSVAVKKRKRTRRRSSAAAADAVTPSADSGAVSDNSEDETPSKPVVKLEKVKEEVIPADDKQLFFVDKAGSASSQSAEAKNDAEDESAPKKRKRNRNRKGADESATADVSATIEATASSVSASDNPSSVAFNAATSSQTASAPASMNTSISSSSSSSSTADGGMGYLSKEALNYYRSLANTLSEDAFGSPEEKSLFVNNVLEEMCSQAVAVGATGKMTEKKKRKHSETVVEENEETSTAAAASSSAFILACLCCHAKCSHLVENLLSHSSPQHLLLFFKAIRPHVIKVWNDRCGSHVMQKYLTRIHHLAKQEAHDNIEQIKEHSKLKEFQVTLTTEDNNQDDKQQQAAPVTTSSPFTSALLSLCYSLKDHWIASSLDPHGSFLCRQLISILSGAASLSTDQATLYKAKAQKALLDLDLNDKATTGVLPVTITWPLLVAICKEFLRQHDSSLDQVIFSPSGVPVIQALLIVLANRQRDEEEKNRWKRQKEQEQAKKKKRSDAADEEEADEEPVESSPVFDQADDDDDATSALVPAATILYGLVGKLLRWPSFDKATSNTTPTSTELHVSTVSHVWSLCSDKSASHLMETIFDCSDHVIIDHFGYYHLLDNVLKFAKNDIANFTLQHFLTAVQIDKDSTLLHVDEKKASSSALLSALLQQEKEKEKVARRWARQCVTELIEEIPALLKSGKVGVVWRLLDLCMRIQVKESKVFKTIRKCIECAEEHQGHVIKEFLYATNLQSEKSSSRVNSTRLNLMGCLMLQSVIYQGVGEYGIKSKHQMQSTQMTQAHTPDENDISASNMPQLVMPTLKLRERASTTFAQAYKYQQMVQNNANQTQANEPFTGVIQTIIKEDSDFLLELATDSVGSRLMEAMIESASVTLSVKQQFVKRFQGRAIELALSQCGSFFLEKCFQVVTTDNQMRIAEELLLSEKKLVASKSGAFIYKKFRLEHFKQHRYSWRTSEESRRRASGMLAEMFETGAKKAPPKQQFKHQQKKPETEQPAEKKPAKK